MYEDWISDLAGRITAPNRPRLCAELADLARLRAATDAREARLLAAVDALDDRGAPSSTVARNAARCSQREADRRARRSATLQQLPQLADALADGRLSIEHVDALGRAAEATSADAVAASGLVEQACRRPADLTAKDARDWSRRQQTQTAIEEQQRRRHRARKVSLFENDDGMVVLHGEFDPVTGAEIRSAIDTETNRLFHADGGRGLASGSRTVEQRRADAVAALLTGNTRGRAGSSAPPPVRNQLLVLADLADGTLGRGRLVDGTPLPAEVLERLSCGSDLFGLVFAGPGDPLWAGRTTRLATDAQWRALIARDGGCRICDAHPAKCEAHHIVAWQSPGGGPTDIDNLILLCRHHHHLVHDLGLRLVRADDGAWRLEPP